MLTKQDLYAAGLKPTNAQLSSWGCDGWYCHAVAYLETGNSDEFYKIELRQEPIPPGVSLADTWSVCFTLEHAKEVLASGSYYETLRKVKTSAITVDDELLELYDIYSKIFQTSWTEFSKLDPEMVKACLAAFKKEVE